MKTNILTNIRVLAILMFCLMTLGVGNAWGDTYALVTDASSLESGDQIIIVNDDSSPSIAISTTQASNNRTGTDDFTLSNSKITPGDAVQIITLGTATKDANTYWTFSPSSGNYLYAGASNANKLLTKSTLDDNGKWDISISSGTATITAQGTNRPRMRYNPNNGSPIFACYATSSTTGTLVRIYKKEASGYTVTIDRNNSSYGTVSTASVTNVTSGTSISASGNVLSVGATNVTATPNSGYKFNNWTGIPGGGTVTGNVTVTANFAAVSYINYRTLCTPPSDPSITVSPASITNLDYIVGQGPSAAQNITLGGSNLTASITITAPTNFEVSIDGGSTYGDSKTVTQTGGEPDVTTVKVHLKADRAVNTYGSSNVTFESTGATTQNVAVTGHVLKPTISVDPASITGWNAVTGSAPTPATKTVSVTGVNLKANISATLTSGSDYFSISPASITQTSGSASGTITISVKAAAYASAATRSGNIRLSTTDGDNVDVPITLLVQDDPREKFELLTSSNIGQLTPGAKLVLVYDNYDILEETHTFYAMTETQNGSNGHEQTTTGFEMLSTNTILAIAENNPQSVQVLELVETATDNIYALYTGSTKNTYLCNSASNKMNEAADFTNDNAKWSITVDGDGYAIIDAQGGNTQQIGFNTGASGAQFRCYNSGYSIYAYFKPSTTPTINVSPASLSDFTYVYGNGPSSPAKTFTVSGMNLSGTLTVALTAGSDKYEISKTSATTGFGSSVTFTGLDGTLTDQTIWVRLKAGLTVGAKSGTITVSGAGVAVGNNKTVSLTGSVTNAFHTVTISAGANGSVSPSGAQSVEEGQTLTVTPTPNTGYAFSSWTVTGSGSSCVGTTFTMGTVDATLTANFSQIMVSGITVSGDATIKTSTSKTYTATVTPAGALTKTVTWSVINGTGTASINSSTGELTAGSPGTVTVRATANDGSGVYGELSVTVQDVVRYKFVKMTSTPSPWEDDEYLIVNEANSAILKASDPLGNSDPSTGAGATKSVTITSSTITLEDDKDDAVHISYVDTKGFLVQAVGGYRQYIVQNGTNTGGTSMKTLASDNTTNTRYWSSIAHNLLKYQSTYNIAYNSSSFRFYNNNYTGTIVLYRLETAYTITCNTPTNGTLSSDMASAASGTTVTLTVTPSTGYELNTLTITKEGGGTITPTNVDETHYTFTMPKDNVTVTATFVTLRTKDIIFHTPECVTTPSTLSGKATGATVTLPSEPAGTPDGFTFEGWVMASVDDPVSVKPTTYAPGDYTVPSGAANINMYALYSEGELSVSGSFSNITTAGNLTVPGYYIIGMASSGSQSVLSNTLSGKHIAPATVNPSSCSSAAAVWEITKPDSYWRVRNISTGTYVASTGTEKEATLIADASSDAAKWTVTATDAGYRFANKLLDDNSATRKYLGYASASTDYRTMASGAGGDVLYLFKAGGGVVTDNTTYTTDPKCYCDYRLMVSTNTGSTWTEAGCFTKVEPEDDSDHEWQLSNFTMPAHNSSTLLKVQRQGYDYGGQTASWQSGWIPLAELQGGSCTYKAFELEGAVGTLRIYDVEGGNSVDANSNFYLGFYPTYQITHGVDGGGAWANESFELVDAETHKYQTAVTTAPTGYFADNNYKFYIGARKSDGTTKYASKNDGGAQDKSNTQKMNTMGGMTSDVGGRSGVYQIYSNSCDQNWYCTFIPYYVVYYHDVNGNEIEEWRDVLTSPTTTVHAYASGQTGWATSQGGAASATYNAGASITPAADVHLYQVAPTYTVSYSVAEESSAYDGRSVKVIQGQAIELPTITFSCARYPNFVGWISGDPVVESDPEVKTEIPSTFVGAGGDNYIPTGNVTLRALYGHNCDGNAGWQKQTTISAGKYIIVAGTYGFSGLESAVSSTTNQGLYLSDVTVTDNTVASSTGMHEVDVILGVNGTFAIQYSSGQYMENSSGYFNGNITSLASAYRWKMNASGQIYDASATTMFLQINNSNHKFKCYAGTQTTYANLFKFIKTGYYTTDPTCSVPSTFTLSFDGNKPDGAAGSVEDVPDNIVRSFSPYPTLATAIDLDADITNPTLTGWKLTGWNTEANGSGTAYALDATIDEYTGSGLTLYAQWERVYTVTLYDNGVLRTTLTQASAGATVALPSGNNCTPGSAFTFEGWTESAVVLNADPVRPAAATLHAAGDYTPTSDIALYSVYSRSVAGCDDFAEHVSGAYKLTNKGSSDYALVTANANRYDKAASGTAEIFYIAYSDAKSAYTIRTSLGYLGWSGASGSEQLTKNNATPYYWDIKEGTGGNAGYWNFQPIGASTKQFSGNGTYFNFGSNSTKYYIQLTKNAMTYYYNTALCDDAKITFHDGGGSISGTPTIPAGASWNSTTHVLSGLEDCDKITDFPTASYDGWTFVGWSTEDYTNSGRHTAGTVHYSDENASTDEPDASIIYKTGGNSFVVRGGSMDLYPVFTRFPENEPFDLEAGGRYYMYYLDEESDDGYGAPARRYAGEWDGTKRYTATTTCANATEFAFTKVGDVWHIQNTSNDKWLGGKSSDDWLVENNSLGTLTDWTITIRSGNQFNATCQSGRQISVFENFFMDYSSNNIGTNPGYHCVYLGSCEERIFSSEPHAVPTIDLVGSPMITSSVGQRVRATEAMTLKGSHLAGATKITLSGTNLTFATSATATPAANLEVTVTSGSVAETDIYVYYTPAGGDTSDGIENIIITATDNGDAPAEAKASVSVRHLPADFVIAAKWGDKWYALPNTCTSSGSSTTGVVITVDDDNDPTCATAAPDNTKWGLRQTKQPARITAGYADRLTFTERGTTATADNQQALYNYNSADVYTNAMWTNYAATNPDRYEWIPVTSDFKDYTLANAYAPTTRFLILRNDGVFAAQNTNQAYGGKVRLLPATFYTEAEMQVVEWKASSVVVMYTGSGVTATTKVGSSSEGSAQTLTAKKVDHGVYELTTGSLTSAMNQQLIITIKNGSSAIVGKKAFVIPAIISTDKTADYVVSGADAAEKIAKAALTDVVILDGKTLSAVATKYTFKNITVYPGGKLVIGSGKQLGMSSLTLRGGSSWGAAEYEYKYPQFIVNNTTSGAYSNSAGVINYDYVTTKDQYYTFVLPYNGSTSTIKYPVDIYGSNVSASNTGSFEFQYYNGAARAAGGNGWTTLAEPATLVAGTGYTFLGMPKKVDAYNGTDDSHSTTRQTYGIHRIPMSVAAATVQSGETNSSPGKSTPITVTLSDKNNASGWVLVGNPFMGDVTGLDNTDIQVGNLIHTDTDPWDGKWRWDPESSQRFVVIPSDNGQTYESEEVSTAELPAFKNFFVQIKSSSVTSLVIPASSRDDAGLAPARFAAQEEKDIRLAVDLVSDTRSDKVDLLINDAYSAEFDEDADFTKMMNNTNFNIYGVYPGDNLSFIAVNKTTASNSIPIGYQVPAGGEYTLRLSDRQYVMDYAIEALYVTDHEVEPEITTDLLTGPYVFHVNNAETNDTRFTMAIVMAPKIPTDIDVIEHESGKIDASGTLKFIYHDKMYIQNRGVLYDATGKRVRVINK